MLAALLALFWLIILRSSLPETTLHIGTHTRQIRTLERIASINQRTILQTGGAQAANALLNSWLEISM